MSKTGEIPLRELQSLELNDDTAIAKKEPSGTLFATK